MVDAGRFTGLRIHTDVELRLLFRSHNVSNHATERLSMGLLSCLDSSHRQLHPMEPSARDAAYVVRTFFEVPNIKGAEINDYVSTITDAYAEICFRPYLTLRVLSLLALLCSA